MGLSDEEFPLFGEGVGGQSPLRSVAGEGLEGERDTETQRRRDGETKCAPATSSLRLSVSSSLLSHHASGSPHIPTSAKIRMGDRPPSLPPMSLQQEVMTDYATAGLSLKRHPVSFVRRELTRRGIITAAQLAQRQSGWVSIAGIVLIRQRPGTASGIVFVTLEDETGVANLIIRPDVFDRFSLAARKASLLQAEGRIQREGQVIHVMTYRLSDLTQLLSNQEFPSRDFR
jgi:error-prone DNA polymerase